MLRSKDAIVSTPVSSALAARVGLGEVDPVHLVDLERTKEQQRIDDQIARKADHRPDSSATRSRFTS